ncbi:uncharacterized protein LOC129766589 [Toxorhynchites rutilus septentrionalis]|uniref:uncharacterized protein LOC129766589 n=1 Tax=Toxorhynchites rutilus septentrionalis TaxID=329112 RepID=UPI00247AEAA7|nr:uncharacterized protein LOC129766589 [Toxorhynchites rutilus septentrionalis]
MGDYRLFLDVLGIRNASKNLMSLSPPSFTAVLPTNQSPPFAGNPADWPIFISSFVNTTAACGYSSVENLTRLQRCLKGAAYEAVRSRLLLPESVPQVINTLQLLYGRPELLINVLLDKVRSTPAPKAERLETLIEFGMAVQSLCDHLEAAGQQSHLMNPCLLMELVEKLPAHVKMEWASFMQRFPEVNLKTFGTFMDGIVVSASKVTRYTGGYGKGASVDKSTTKNRGSINTHVSQPEVPKKEDKPCGVCKRRGHRVRDCDNFKALSVDDRWKTAQDNELCRSCLNAHGRRSCRSATQCGINGCPFRHHPLLHSNRSNRPSSGSTAPRVAYNIETAGNHAHRMQDQSLLFRIIPVTLYGPKRTVKTFAFLDDGSSLTLVEEELTNKIGIDGIPAPLCLTWTGNVSRIEAESKQLQLEVSSANGGKHHQLKNVRTVKKLALPGQTLRINEFVDRYKHLRGLPLSGYENAVPQLLIGVKNLRFTLPLKVKEGDSNEPVVMKTRLGWCVYGGIDTSLTNAVNFHACDCDSDRALHELVKDYFTLEDVGSRPKNELLSADDRRAQHILEKTTTRVGNQFETGLLWRYDEVEFPDSYGMALRRLECLERRMVRNPLLKEKIHRQIEEYQQKGYTHRANEEEVKAVDPRRVWYLPLGAVVNPKKPEKVRLIWDDAAVVDGISLNAMLLKGPDQLTSLPAVLSRFRQFAVAVAADILEMFHQLRIRGIDRHSLRFLFREDPTVTPDVYVMDVATFGATCSPASAQYVKNRNAADFADKYPRAVEGIIENHYVDDYLDSFGTVAEEVQISEQVRAIHSTGDFLLRNWLSNSATVKQQLGEITDSSNKHLFHDKTTESGRVLGMLWLTDEDALSFSAQLKEEVQQIVENESRPTKRQVLRVLMSFFDPLGLLSPWSMCYRQLQLHVFVDASEAAYVAVAYFRIVDTNGTSKCALVTAKSKVAPLKHLSIPRMELQAAVLGTRLMRFILESHTVTITERYMWSDSTTVLAWLRADPRKYKQYVACRIGEILEQTDVNEWWWVPSKNNPADYATKWGSGPSVDVTGAWFQGPSFLYQPMEGWPKQKVPLPMVEEEFRPCNVHVEAAVPTAVIDCERFSKWERLLSATAYVHRYVGNLKRSI